ncbi:MAG TPA: DNA polymerase III subunit beta [Candidatus Paceibacterota bacterium]
MKIECVKSKITNLLQKIERVAGKTQNLPILGCFLLQVVNGKLVISSTNLDLGVIGEVSVRVLKEGRVAVPVSVLSSLLTQLPQEGNVLFESAAGVFEVITKQTKTSIKTLNPDDFPNIPKTEGSPITLPAQDFIKGLRAVWYAAAISSMKPELSSVYIHYDQKNLVFAATDSFRLAEKKIPVKKITDFHPLLIPFKNVSDTIRLFEDYRGDLEIVINKNQISFWGGEVYVVSRLVEGTFPDYEQIVPKTEKTEAVVLKQDFVSALKIATIFSNTFHQVGFLLSPNKKAFELETYNEHVGKNTMKLDAVLKGEELSMNFNHRYITDCFQSIAADSLLLRFNGPHKPLVVQGVGDQSFTYLVMPMNR